MCPKDSMQTTIYLVRHGQTNWNLSKRFQGQRKVPINKVGKEQAKLLAKELKGTSFDVVYSSPILRAMQTARVLASKHTIITCKDLRELDRPKHEGLFSHQIKKLIPDIEAQWACDGIDWRSPLGGETLREYQTRSVKAFKDIIEKNNGKRILVVTHGGPLKAIVNWIHGGKPEDFLHVRNPENAECVVIVQSGKKVRITGFALKVGLVAMFECENQLFGVKQVVTWDFLCKARITKAFKNP